MKLLRSRIFIFAVCSIAAVFLVFFIMPKYNSSTKEVVQIVGTVKHIPPGTLITSDMLKMVNTAKFNLPEDVIRDKKDIVGKYSKIELFPQDRLIPQKFATQNGLNDSFLYSLEGKTAVSVSVKSLAAGLSGKLQPGDVVSVYSYVKAKDPKDDGTVKDYPELEFVEVGAVNNNKAQDTIDIKTKEEKDKNGDSTYQDTIVPSTVTLLVSRSQAKLLVDIENNGTIHLVFRGRGEDARKLLKKEG